MTSLLIADFIQGVLLFIFILATCYTLLFGKKGTGIIKDPEKAIYNKVYEKTSFSIFDLFKKL